jgi:hypothetical protein
MVALVAVLVLLFFVPFLGTLVLQGVATILEIIWFIGYSLWCLWRDSRAQKQKVPAPPTRSRTTAKSPKPRKPVDPRLQKTRDMQIQWQHQGHRVGLVNLDSGEVYEPAGVDDEKGDRVE